MLKRIISKEDEILTEIIKLSEIVSESGNEILRSRYLQSLMIRYGITNAIIDAAGNCVGKIEGKETKKALVLSAHIDTLYPNTKVKLTLKNIIGEGVGDNSLGVYVIAFLASLLKNKDLNCNVYFVGTTEGETSLNGISYFLDNIEEEVVGLINVEGLGLGRINTTAVSLIRLNLEFKGEGGHLWKDFGKNSPVYGLARFINKIREEEVGENVVFNVGEIKSGIFYNLIPRKAELKMEIRGLDIEEVKEVTEIMKQIARGISEEEHLNLKVKEEYLREGAKLNESVLEEIFVDVNKELGIRTRRASAHTEILIPLQRGIDAITVGVAKGGNRYEVGEYIDIKSIYSGIKQIYDAVLKFNERLGAED